MTTELNIQEIFARVHFAFSLSRSCVLRLVSIVIAVVIVVASQILHLFYCLFFFFLHFNHLSIVSLHFIVNDIACDNKNPISFEVYDDSRMFSVRTKSKFEEGCLFAVVIPTHIEN